MVSFLVMEPHSILADHFMSKSNVNMSLPKITKNLGLLSSEVHNIVKRFRDSREITVMAKGGNYCCMCVTSKPLGIIA